MLRLLQIGLDNTNVVTVVCKGTFIHIVQTADYGYLNIRIAYIINTDTFVIYSTKGCSSSTVANCINSIQL